MAFALFSPSVYPICHYFVVPLSSVLMVASIDGNLPLLAACHCSLLLLLKNVNVLTWQINSLSLSPGILRPNFTKSTYNSYKLHNV